MNIKKRIKMLAFFITYILIHISYSWSDIKNECNSLVGIKETDTLFVSINVQGCMDKITFNLFFTLGDTGITSFLYNSDSTSDQIIIGKKEISFKDAAMIVGYIQYIRMPPEYHANCTSIDNIILTWKKWKNVVITEKFIDRTCFSIHLTTSFWSIFSDINRCCNENKNMRKCIKNGISCK